MYTSMTTVYKNLLIISRVSINQSAIKIAKQHGFWFKQLSFSSQPLNPNDMLIISFDRMLLKNDRSYNMESIDLTRLISDNKVNGCVKVYCDHTKRTQLYVDKVWFNTVQESISTFKNIKEYLVSTIHHDRLLQSGQYILYWNPELLMNKLFKINMDHLDLLNSLDKHVFSVEDRLHEVKKNNKIRFNPTCLIKIF